MSWQPKTRCDPNAPAFPSTYPVGSPQDRGLTKREYFAAKAMEGMLSLNQRGPGVASIALNYADDLIKELNEGT